MPVTVKVNGNANSLVHKGSNHISMATIPDVCKTPSPGGPVPIPYPNISQSAMLAKGTTTVKADGMMAAIKGSEFSLSNGDNAGVAGGVKSSTFMKESTWILYSFDVKMDGQGACRLSDKKFQNHENTVDLGGAVGPPVVPAIVWPPNDGCAGPSTKEILPPGTKIDRYGYDGGSFVSPAGTPAPMRSLAPGTTAKPFSTFEVLEPIEVETCEVAPWFGEPGGGKQHKLPSSVDDLLKSVPPKLRRL